MATLSELEGWGKLARLDPGLPVHVQELRLIYALPRLTTWLADTLPDLRPSWTVELTPGEQFAIYAELFCSGEVLTYQKYIKPLHFVGGGVWELKTPDLRVFGWFYAKDTFIGVCADTADRIKQHGLYSGYAGEVERERNTINLNEPKFIAGREPSDVVSNSSFS